MRGRDPHFVSKHVVRSKSCRRRSPLLVALITTIWDQRVVTYLLTSLFPYCASNFVWTTSNISSSELRCLPGLAGCHCEVGST